MRFFNQLLCVLFVLVTVQSSQSKAASVINLPTLLRTSTPQGTELYTPQQVCKETQRQGKKMALVLLKTNLCDPPTGTAVCINSLSFISDMAGVFYRRYVATFHTRFWEAGAEHILSTGESKIRPTWNKFGVNPEFVILDATNCSQPKVIHRQYMRDAIMGNVRANDYTRASIYRGLRDSFLFSVSVRNILGLKNSTQLASFKTADTKRFNELAVVYNEPDLSDLMDAMIDQAKLFGIGKTQHDEALSNAYERAQDHKGNYMFPGYSLTP